MTAGPRTAAVLLALLGVASLWWGGVPPHASTALELAVAALALSLAARRRPLDGDGSAVAIAVGWGALALGSAAWSVAPDASLDAAGGVLAACALFLAGATGLDRSGRRAVVLGVLALGAVISSLAIARVAPQMRAASPFGNPNHLAGWLLLPGAIAAVALVREAGHGAAARERVLYWSGLALLCGAGVAVTRSRGAAAAAGAAALAVWAMRRLGPARAAPVIAGGWLAAALALAALPAWNPGLVPPAGPAGESSAGLRWSLYASAARSAWHEAPWGSGLGTFSVAFRGARPGGLPYGVRHAHSEPLEGAVELGLLFGVALLATIGLAVRRSRRGPEGPGSLAYWGASAAGLALASHALVDFPLHVPAIAWCTAVLAGVWWGETGRPVAGEQRRAPGLARAAGVGLALALVATAGTQSVALVAQARSESALARGDFEAAVARAEQGLLARPGRVALWSAIAEAWEASHSSGGGGPEALAHAILARERAVSASPCDPALHIALARTAWHAGDSSRALAELARAQELDPSSPVPELARARLLLAAGDGEAAADALRRALELHPEVSGAALQGLLRAAGEPTLVLRAAPGRAASLGAAGRLLARAGHARDAARALERAVAIAPGDIDVVLEAAATWISLREPAPARAALEDALARHPGEPRLQAALERMARSGGPAGGRS